MENKLFPDIREFYTKESDYDSSEVNADIARLLKALDFLEDGIRKSIARSDDYADSYCSQPIRQALAQLKELSEEK